MKKAALIISVIILSLLLTSCRHSTEVQRRVVVHALGIDPHEKGYEVSYQIFSGKAPDGNPVDADESTVVTLLAQGRTLYETEESLRLQTGKEVFLGDAELIVISEKLIDTDLTDFLQYFRESDIYLGVNVVYCTGSAAETIGSKLNQGSATAILLRGVVEEAIRKSRALSARIIEISNALEHDGETIAAPVLTLEKNELGEDLTLTDTTLGVFGSQLISPEGPKSKIDENAVMGLSILNAKAKDMSLEVKIPEGIASVEISDMKIKRKIRIRDGIPEISVSVSARYSAESSPVGANEEEIRLAAQEQTLSLCEAAYACRLDGDVFQLGKQLWKYEPDYMMSIGGDVGDVIKKTTVSAEVRFRKY